MDDPSNRFPGAPPGAPLAYGPQAAQAPYAPAPQPPYAVPPAHAPAPVVYGPPPVVVQAPPPVAPAPVPVVSVQVSNVLVPQAAPPVAPMHAPLVQAPPPHVQAPPPHVPPPAPRPAPGVVDMMRDDAAHRMMEAVARRGPARVLAYSVGTVAFCAATVLFASLAFGASLSGVLLGSLPLLAIGIAAFVIGARAGRGVASHHLERAILSLASENRGVVRVVALAQSTGRPLRECQLAIDAMVASGHATVESDETGGLVYRVPDLEPKRNVLPIEVTVVPTDRGSR